MQNHLVIVLLVTTLILALGLSREAQSAFTSAAFVIGGGVWLLLRLIDKEGPR